jgi:hypothetical protein
MEESSYFELSADLAALIGAGVFVGYEPAQHADPIDRPETASGCARPDL